MKKGIIYDIINVSIFMVLRFLEYETGSNFTSRGEITFRSPQKENSYICKSHFPTRTRARTSARYIVISPGRPKACCSTYRASHRDAHRAGHRARRNRVRARCNRRADHDADHRGTKRAIPRANALLSTEGGCSERVQVSQQPVPLLYVSPFRAFPAGNQANALRGPTARKRIIPLVVEVIGEISESLRGRRHIEWLPFVSGAAICARRAEQRSL